MSSKTILIGSIALVAASGLGLAGAWWYRSRQAAPSLLQEIPSAELVVWRRGEKCVRSERVPKGATESVLALRSGERKAYVEIWAGEFDRAQIESEYRNAGFEWRTEEGFSVLGLGDRPESRILAWACGNRVIQGSQDLVIEALRLREGRGPSAQDSLTEDERRLIRMLAGGDLLTIDRGVTDGPVFGMKERGAVLSVADERVSLIRFETEAQAQAFLESSGRGTIEQHGTLLRIPRTQTD